MVDLKKQAEEQRAARGPSIVQQPPLSNGNQTNVTKANPFVINVSGDVGYGSYFTGTVLNKDSSKTIDAVLVDGASQTSFQIPPNLALNFVNVRCTVLTVQVDAADPLASIPFVLNGSVRAALNEEACDMLLKETEIFFRSSTPKLVIVNAGAAVAIGTPGINHDALSEYILFVTANQPTCHDSLAETVTVTVM